MSKYLFFDTETTGKAQLQAAPDAEYQPRIVQLAALLCDESANELASINLIVKCIVKVPEDAAKIHGITTETALSCGVPIFHALLVFEAMTRQADLLVAHNIDFDSFVVEGESRRVGAYIDASIPKFCTMKAMVPVCKIPGAYSDYKWPRLSEAYKHCFGKDFENAHDAMADLRATKDVFFWLKKQEAK